MYEKPKFAFLQLWGDTQSLQIDFDEDLLKSLVEEDGWIEVTKTGEKVSHYLFPLQNGAIRQIKWEE